MGPGGAAAQNPGVGPWRPGRTISPVAGLLIAVGVGLFLLTLGLAFTVYGLAAAGLGAASFTAGVWLLARRPAREADGS